jgi:hypothetical protein
MNMSVPLSESAQVSETICYHEAGHAVMARLFGRQVHHIALVLNVENTYNGYTDWGRDELIRDWDLNIPYDELGFEPQDRENSVALIIVAGKAAERIWYRQRGLDESLASFGPGGGTNNDAYQLEKELEGLKHPVFQTPRLKPEELPEVKQKIEDLAVRLLEHRVCWQAVETVAKALLKNLQEQQIKLSEVQVVIAGVFEKVAQEEKNT